MSNYIKSLNGYLFKDEEARNAVAALEGAIPSKVSDLNNDSGFITANDIPEVAVPTKTSELTNDSGFITADDIPAAAEVPTKTSDLTNDSGFITDTNTFVAIAGTTTNDEIASAINSGKIVVCSWNGA